MRIRIALLLCAGVVLLLAAVPEETGLTIRGGREHYIREAVEALGSSVFGKRERATRLLLSLGEETRDDLAKALDSEDAEVRRRARDILFDLDRRRESPGERRDREYRRLVAIGVRTTGALRPDTARFAALALDPRRAAGAAVDVGRSVQDRPLMLQRAVILLRDLERPEGAPFLAETLARGGVLPSTLHHAAQALRVCGGPDEVPAIAEAVRSPDSFARRHALRALAAVGGPAEFPLARLASRDPDRNVRAEAARALPFLGGLESRSRLTALTLDREAMVRVAALESLAMVGGEGTRSVALRALEDASGDVRATGVRILAACGDPGDAGVLRDLLRDPSARVRGEAVRAIGALGDLEAAVRAGVLDDSPAVRRVALESAKLLPAGAARDVVEAAPTERDPYLTRLRAALIRGGTN